MKTNTLNNFGATFGASGVLGYKIDPEWDQQRYAPIGDAHKNENYKACKHMECTEQSREIIGRSFGDVCRTNKRTLLR